MIKLTLTERISEKTIDLRIAKFKQASEEFFVKQDMISNIIHPCINASFDEKKLIVNRTDRTLLNYSV